MNYRFQTRIIASLLLFLLLIPSTLFADNNHDDNYMNIKPTQEMEDIPQFKEASVHDPSVIKVNDNYYIFGSHLTAAKSKDLMSWETIASGVSDGNKLMPNVKEELKETLDWAQSDTLWAPDVIQLADGKFYMYYNACKGDSPRSALGVAVADNVEGPYKDLGIILKSGMWGLPSEDGTIYDATKHPNTVDPDVFFDNKGNLWMVYGSFSGGIFILKMDPATGKPFPGQGYGKKLMGGNHSRIEGSNMLYSPKTDYYYMFVTFGGLDSKGGYNIRVARSKNPDGPFYDAEGNDMINVKANPSLPLFDDASIQPYGVKLAGNFLFRRAIGDPGEGNGIGYVSPGGSTAYYDSITGKYFLIFHTRFPSRGEEHEVRVHQMVMNEDGWPVLAPYRYVGEKEKKVDSKEVAGDYKVINHGKDISASIKEFTVLHFGNDGKIAGTINGTWKIIDQSKAQLTLDGISYDGVFLRQWDTLAQRYVMTFSALSSKGAAVWGARMLDLNDHQIVEAVQQDLNLGDTTRILTNMTLPTEGTRETSISWSSSDPDIVSADGVVNRPAIGAADATVTLTAKIAKGTVTATKSFTVIVLQHSKVTNGLAAQFDFEGNLADAKGNFTNGTVIGSKIGVAGGTLSYGNGVTGQAAVFDGSSGIQLPNGLISSNEYTVSLWVNPDQLTSFTTTFFGAKDSNSWVSVVPQSWDNNTMLWSGSAWYDGITGMKISNGVWTHLAFTVNNGNVVFYINGVPKFIGTGFPNVFTTSTGIFTLGVNWWDTPYKGKMDDLQIYEVALSAEQVAELASVTPSP